MKWNASDARERGLLLKEETQQPRSQGPLSLPRESREKTLGTRFDAFVNAMENNGIVPFDQKFRFEFPKFRMSNGTVFSTRPDRSRSVPAWAHFPQRITRENAEGSLWSGSLKCRKLLHVEKFNTHSEFNSSLIFMRGTKRKWGVLEKLTNFSRRRVYKPGKLTHRKFWTNSPQFSWKSDPNVFRFRSRTGSNYGRSFCI